MALARDKDTAVHTVDLASVGFLLNISTSLETTAKKANVGHLLEIITILTVPSPVVHEER